MRPTRRRFLTILAGLPALGLPGPARAGAGAGAPIRGHALGAQVTLHLDHPQAARLGAQALRELARLERIFSLYRADSALATLNRTGQLADPPPELLECLGTCAAVHRASGGRFDPTIQPLWAALATAHAARQRPDPSALAHARTLIGWSRVRISPQAITLNAGMALTLNGVAQGYVTDKVATLLRHEGLTVGLIDAGEIVAIGPDWPVTIENGPRLRLTDRALATSGPFGTVLDQDGRQGHILSPHVNAPAPVWHSVSVRAPTAGLADALSTAGCLMPDLASLNALVAGFAGCDLVHLNPVANTRP